MHQLNNSVGQLNINHSLGGAAEFGALINHLIGKIQTITLVKVESVHATGVAPVGTVDVHPLVQQIDGMGNVVSLGTLYGVPYFRLQGGVNAVICDPAVGDLGLCAFASRDISKIKQNKAESAPNSRRQYDWSDGLYLGGFLNGTPEQYICFQNGGIKIVSPGDIELNGKNIKLNASAGVSSTSQTFQANTQSTAQFTGGGGINADGDIKAGSVSLQNHTHKGVQTGSSDTGEPNA